MNTLKTRLAAAEAHVLSGEALIERQRRIVDQLRIDGRDTRTATELLNELLAAQQLHIAEVTRLRSSVTQHAAKMFERSTGMSPRSG